MITYKMADVVKEISVRENNPVTSKYDKFVGLEHYITGEVVIRQYGGTGMLNSAMKVFQAGDILVARRNVYLRRASTVDFDGLTSGDSIVLRAENPRIAKLLPFILNSDRFWDYADQHADGTMSKRLSPKILMQYEFTLPSEEEQDRLIELLWSMDRTKQAYKQLISATDELVKSQFIEMFGDPIANAQKYPVLPFTDFASIDAQMTTDYEKYADYPHIGIGSIEKDTGRLFGYRTVAEDGVKSGKYIFSPAHIIYSKIRPNLNKVALPDFEGLCSADAYPILPNSDNCDKLYLAFVLRSKWFLGYIVPLSGHTNMPKANREQINRFTWALPPLELQKQFAAFVRQTDKSKFAIQLTGSNLNLWSCLEIH